MSIQKQSEAYWRSKLLALQSELEMLDPESADSRGAVELDQARVGRLSRMDAMQGQAMSNAIAGRRRQTLNRIAAALFRLDSGEFGYCLVCGEPISEKRLELDPTVTTCVHCKK